MERRKGRRDRQWAMLTLALVATMLSGSCSEKPQVVRLEIRALPRGVQTAAPGQQPWSAVSPLADARSEGSPLGSRRQIWGGTTYFNMEGGEVGEVVAQVFVDYLKHERGWRSWLAKPGVTPPEAGPQVRLGGRILDFAVTTRNWLIVTTMTVRTKLHLELSGPNGREPYDVVIARSASSWSFGFSQDDMEALVNQTLVTTLQDFLARAKVDEPGAGTREGT